MFQAGPASARRRMSPATAGPKNLHPGSSNGHTPSRVTSKTSRTSRQRKIAVKDPLEELIPWLRTASPFDAALGTPALPDLSALPGLSVLPWDYPWPHQSPLKRSVSSKPPTFSSSEPSGASGGLLSRYAQPPEDPWSRAARSLGDHSPHPISSGLPLAFPPPMAYPDLPKYWDAPPAPWSARTRPDHGLDFLPEPPAQNYPTRFTNTAQTFSEPRAASSSNAPVSSTNAAPAWPVHEFDLTQDALRAGAEKTGRWGRRAPVPYPAPIPPSPEHVESAQYWRAGPGPSAASEQPVNGFYLSPVGKAPSWEQVAPTATPWSVSPKLPSPTSWGEVSSGVECYTSGGNLHCITPGGRRFTVPAEGLPDGLRIAPGDPDFHYYSTSVGPQPGNLRRPMPGVINDPTPALRSMVRPATPEGTENPAAPWYAQLLGTLAPSALNPLSGSPSWPVRSYTTTDQNGTPLVVNVTQPGHPLYPGVVVRYGTTSPSGAMIHNEGSGLAVEQGPRSWIPRDVRDWAADHVWRGQSEDILKGGRRHQPRELPLGR